MEESNSLEELIEKLIFYKNAGHQLSINKFSKNWVLAAIEESNEIKLIEQRFKDYDARGTDIVDFVRIFLSIIEHTEEETLYIVIGLIDLFKEICEAFNLSTNVKSSDVLNFIVDTFIHANASSSHLIPTRKVPEKRRFGNEQNHIREIDINAPVVYGESFGSLKRFVKSKLITDSVHHANNSVKAACYASSIKKIFALDSLADNICVYDLNCKLTRRICPKAFQEKKDIIILNFAWSNKQNRLGSCLKDFTMVFWDASDDFTFEKSFSTAETASDYQSNIWYIEFLNLWLTTDKTNEIHAWNIERESRIYSIKSERIKSSIIDIVPVDVLNLIAVSSMDKLVTFWDLSRRFIVLEINLASGGIHSVIYSSTYQTLITAGYENMISIWNINPHYFDYTQVGRLIGHTSMVTAVQVIEKTPMIVSADDSGNVKVWDLRNLSCLQTLNLGSKTVITTLIDMYECGKMCFVGSRINMLEFEDMYDIKNKQKAAEVHWPIRVEYNYTLNELIICTRKDIRFVDAASGRVKKIYSGLLSNNEDDITVFRLVQQNKKFILGDQRGQMSLYLYATGELLKSLKSHANEVSSMKIDYVNKLIISAGWDAQILIQKETKTGFEVKRRVTNAHYRKEISLMEASVYHNIIVTATNSNIIYMWDFEYARLIAMIEIEESAEPSAIQFINGFSIIVISTNIGTVHFFHFKRRDMTHVHVKHVAIIDFEGANNQRAPGNTGSKEETDHPSPSHHDSRGERFVNRILLDVNYSTDESTKPDQAKIYFAKNKGTVRIYDIMELFNCDPEITLVPHTNTRSNYNAERFSNEDFEESIKNYKVYHFTIRPPNHKSLLESNKKRIALAAIRPLNLKKDHSSSASPAQQINSRRQEDDFAFTTAAVLQDTFLDLSEMSKNTIQAHKDAITTLNFIHCPEKKLLTSSLDCYCKIWELNGKLIASKNINHPLPIVWNLDTNSVNKAKKRVLYAMKIIETIFKRYEKKIILSEEKKLNINRFLAKLEDSKPLHTPDRDMEYENSEQRQKKKVLLMKDEYEPRDLQYEKVKTIYQRELQGSSLKQMEITKRLMMAQKTWKDSLKTQSKEEDGQKKGDYSHPEYSERNNELVNYIVRDQRLTLDSLNKEEPLKRTKQLGKRLEIQAHKGSTSPPRRLSRRGLRGTVLSLDTKKPSVEPLNQSTKLGNGSINIEERLDDSPTANRVKKEERAYSPELGPTTPVQVNRKLDLFTKVDDSRHKQSRFTNDSLMGLGNISADCSPIRSNLKPSMQTSMNFMKKKSIPAALDFFDYASQKNLAIASDARSVRSQHSIASTEASFKNNVVVKQRDRRVEFQHILTTLDRRKKKSQLLEPGISYDTIAKTLQTRGATSVKNISAADILTKNKSSTQFPSIQAYEGLPRLNINFLDNMDNFRRSMESVVGTILQESKPNPVEKLENDVNERTKMQEESNQFGSVGSNAKAMIDEEQGMALSKMLRSKRLAEIIPGSRGQSIRGGGRSLNLSMTKGDFTNYAQNSQNSDTFHRNSSVPKI